MVAVVRPRLPELRPMREEDLESIARIEALAYEFPWTLGIFRDCMRAGYACWVLSHDATTIGYAVLSMAAREAHVLNVCVAPDEQGHGHGRRLMRRLVDLARWHQAERVFLEVRPSNRAALALYHQAGFEVIGRRRAYYRAIGGTEDAVVLVRRLRPRR